jgi:hypothetical protein
MSPIILKWRFLNEISVNFRFYNIVSKQRKTKAVMQTDVCISHSADREAKVKK